MQAELPVPVIDDDDTGGYFEAARRGAVALSFCTGCGRVQHLPTPCCRACGGTDLEWRDVAPNGKVYSWTVVTHPVHPAFEVPYTVALVELDDVPEARVVTHLDGRVALHAGQPMHAVFDDVREGGVVVTRWVPTA